MRVQGRLGLLARALALQAWSAAQLADLGIGQMIFLSHRTVSSHLYHAFPKVGSTSRTELRRVLEPSLPDEHGTPAPLLTD